MKLDRIVAFNAVSVATSFTSAPIPADYMFAFSVQTVVASGTSPTGVLSVEVSNDPASSPTPQSRPPTNWTALSMVTSTITDNGIFLIPRTEITYGWIRLVYVAGMTPGTGLLTANIICQGF